MRLLSNTSKLAVMSLSVVGLVLMSGSSALAHVTVSPAEVATAGYQTFTVNVPNEKDIPTVSVKLVIPEALSSATPTQKAGWKIVKETAGSGQDQTVKSITWEGGSISDGTRDEFSFSTKVPEKPTELQWKAYQTYSDGTVVAWDKKGDDGHGHDGEDSNSGPFSVTKVVAEMAQDKLVKQADAAAAEAKTAAERSLYVGTAGVVVAVAAVFLATRKK